LGVNAKSYNILQPRSKVYSWRAWQLTPHPPAQLTYCRFGKVQLIGYLTIVPAAQNAIEDGVFSIGEKMAVFLDGHVVGMRHPAQRGNKAG
jgi:hypothetical protein